MMLQAVGRALTWTPVTLASLIVLGVILGPSVGDTLKHATVRSVAYFLPVKHSMTIDRLIVDGPDVIVSGTMVKRWACDYQPPPRAVDLSGQHYLVESSAATKRSNWPVGQFHYGPWKIHGAAGKKVSIYQEDECLGVGVFSWLSIIDTRTKQ